MDGRVGLLLSDDCRYIGLQSMESYAAGFNACKLVLIICILCYWGLFCLGLVYNITLFIYVYFVDWDIFLRVPLDLVGVYSLKRGEVYMKKRLG